MKTGILYGLYFVGAFLMLAFLEILPEIVKNF